jgi:hypothetical protein
VGIGVVPEAWASNHVALQLGTGANIHGRTDRDAVLIGANTYNDGQWKRIGANGASQASLYEQHLGAHKFFIGASGTADSAISWTNAMTITNGADVLVGKTSQNSSLSGCELLNNGTAQFTRDGNSGLRINRLTSDGELLRLSKAGTTVGSIISDSGSIMLGSGDVGVYFDAASDRILPVNITTGSARNDAIDIGGNPHRFKDLYLSGGVYLGGTGAANKLDDYEEGSWTPTAKGGSTVITVNASEGYYTKIGQRVTVHGFMDTGTLNGATAGFKMEGLPFAVKGQNTRTGIEASGTVSYWAGFATAVNSVSCMAVDGNHIALVGLLGSTATAATDLSAVHVGQSADFRFSITYTAV